MMKKQLKLWSIVAVALMGCALTACNNDNEETIDSPVLIKPAKSPDFLVYSGGNVIGNTFATRTDVTWGVNYFKMQDFTDPKAEWVQQQYPYFSSVADNAPQKTDRDEAVSQAEYDYVMAYIRNHPEEGGTECDLVNYFVQNVGSTFDTYPIEFSYYNIQNVGGGAHMEYVEIGGYHIFDYNAYYGPRALVVGIPVTNPSYHDTYSDPEYRTKYDAYRYYYIEYEGKTACYLAFDYHMAKDDNGFVDYKGDGIYTDWVIKLTPADGSDAVKPGTGGGSGSGETPSDDTTAQKGEVEVNLSVNAQKEEGDYIATKLSIHVRDTTDVDVFIPVPAEYYCEADDMDIVLSHSLVEEQYAANYQTMTYQVDGHDVTLSVAYLPAGIRVTTQGVTADVLRYLRSTYYDGITFEVWNYYKDNITRANLKTLLDGTTISFTTDPGRYVNAFARLDEAQNPWDCTVTPPAAFANTTANTGKPNYNVIYTK